MTISDNFHEMENMTLLIDMPDGSVWAVSALAVAYDRAKCYSEQYDDDVERSLEEDTLPYFLDDHDEIIDWAKNNMNWEDVASAATVHTSPPGVDYQEGWTNGDHKIVKEKA